MQQENKNNEQGPEKFKDRLVNFLVIFILFAAILWLIYFTGTPQAHERKAVAAWKDAGVVVKKENKSNKYWEVPDKDLINEDPDSELIYYGKKLIANTSLYLGPRGEVAQLSNGMNCQNCHLDAGTKLFGNNYSAVASTYPKFRERSGKIETVYKRVNDCFERSLNGKTLDTASKEMQAIAAYIHWLGKDVPKGEKPKGSGIMDLRYLQRAADPGKGKAVYTLKCQSCHGENGEGRIDSKGLAYTYPPLWGENSYNIGAGLYRLSRFAGYVKANMPNGATFEKPQLSDEEAWDVAAFVNSQPRPKMNLKKDWPKISGKPVDHPFGPYVDKFKERQHKYGPFEPIVAAKTKK